MKTRLILPEIYAALFLVALILMLTHAKQTALCGIFAFALTIPWSFVAVPICNRIVPGFLNSSTLSGALILIVCAVLNGAIMFLIGAGIDSLWHGKGK